MNEWMDWWIDEWMNEWMNGWINEWIKKQHARSSDARWSTRAHTRTGLSPSLLFGSSRVFLYICMYVLGVRGDAQRTPERKAARASLWVFCWSGRQRPRRRPGPGAGPAPDLRFRLRSRLAWDSQIRGAGRGGIFWDFRVSGHPEMVIFIVTKWHFRFPEFTIGNRW